MSHTRVPDPSVELTSFACPHCGAHATQSWFNLIALPIKGEKQTPFLASADSVEKMEQEASSHRDEHQREFLSRMAAHFRRILAGEPFISHSKESVYCPSTLENVFVSLCYTCEKPSLWLHDRLMFPSKVTGPPPNPDLSDDIRRDYEEARRILDLSPRGAAALLRLSVEKICCELGADGTTVDSQVAFLVSKGLPVAVQQALDAVRVIGNEAVHPGQVDIRDDRETAARLFELVNFIAEDRISRPKRIDEVYRIIPEGKRKAIDARNAKANASSNT